MTEQLPEMDAATREEMMALARRMIWWKTPEEALQYPLRFLAQVMTIGRMEDVQLAERVFGREAFREVLLNPPPGVFDPRSWNYWHVMFDMPVPPLPRRKIE